MDRLGRVLDRLQDVMAVLAGLLLLFVTFSISYSILVRALGLQGPVWIVQFNEYSLLWITFLGAAWLLRRGKHVTIDSAIQVLGPRAMVMVFMIIAASNTFSSILAFSGATHGLLGLIEDMEVHPILILVSMQIVVFILGAFMETISIMMICLPIFMPIVNLLGFDPVWFGVLMLINFEIGLITPPFGMLLFVIKGVAPEEVTMGDRRGRHPGPTRDSGLRVQLLDFLFHLLRTFVTITLYLPIRIIPPVCTKRHLPFSRLRRPSQRLRPGPLRFLRPRVPPGLPSPAGAGASAPPATRSVWSNSANGSSRKFHVHAGPRTLPRHAESMENPARYIIRASFPSRKEWARMIQKIYETDPLVCPKCNGDMRILAFIENQDMIRKSLSRLPPSEDDLTQNPGFSIDWSA